MQYAGLSHPFNVTASHVAQLLLDNARRCAGTAASMSLAGNMHVTLGNLHAGATPSDLQRVQRRLVWRQEPPSTQPMA